MSDIEQVFPNSGAEMLKRAEEQRVREQTADAPDPVLVKSFPSMFTPEQRAAAGTLAIDVPEGFDPNAPALSEYRKVAGEIGLSPTQASKILELYKRLAQGTR